MQRFEQIADLFSEVGIQGRQGLVQQQQIGLHHQGAGQGRTLLFAAAQIHHAAVQQALQAKSLYQIGELTFAARAFGTAIAQSVLDVLAHGEVGKQGAVLVDDADAAALRGQAGDFAALEVNAAPGHGQQAGHGLQQHGLARAGGSQQNEEFARLPRAVKPCSA